MQEKHHPFAGNNKTFQTSLRAYAHPAAIPVQKIYGKRYSLTGPSNQSNRLINNGVYAQNTLSRSKSASRERRANLKHILQK
jgi:hypothetical protein